MIVCMGRGGPPEPRTARAGIGLIELLDIDSRGEHAASDYLEDAALAGVPTVGCRRVGGGLAGEPAESNVVEGAAMAAAMDPGAILFEGSGSCIPPVEVDRTVCIVGAGPLEPMAEYRLLRADLVLAAEGAHAAAGRASPAPAPEPAEPLPDGRAGGALHHRRRPRAREWSRCSCPPTWPGAPALAEDLDRAAAAGCDVYLTELKAAAIDTVARRALAEGAQVAFVRNRPVGIDDALLALQAA